MKLLWYATRKFYADRLLTIQPETDQLYLYAINDSDAEWTAEVRLARLSAFTESQPISRDIRLSAKPRSVQRIALELAVKRDDTKDNCLLAQCGSDRAFWFFDIDKNLNYPAPQYDSAVSRVGAKYKVTITARTLLRDLCLFADRLDPSAVVNEQLITLLPGESFTFEFNSKRELPAQALTTTPVLQCANRFGKK